MDLEVLFAKQEMDRLEEYIRNTYDYEKKENYKKMIIELSEKYNINSKYTSFITVYERENKLLEVPQYQETTLSNKFARDALMGGVFKMKMSARCDIQADEGVDMGIPSFLRSNNNLNDIDIPSFVKKKKTVIPKSSQMQANKTNREILEEKVNEYYKVFISKNEKSILTFLLYALYFIQKRDNIFNYSDLLIFLRNHKEELLKNEKYQKILYLCYTNLYRSRDVDIRETLDLMDDNFKKIAVTNLYISIEFEKLSENEIQEIINSDIGVDNIDRVIKHLIKNY